VVENVVMNDSIVKGARPQAGAESCSNMSQDMPIFRIALVNRSRASHVRGAVPVGGVNLFLRIVWRTAPDFAKQDAWCCGVG
jgi:hypothetical protein